MYEPGTGEFEYREGRGQVWVPYHQYRQKGAAVAGNKYVVKQGESWESIAGKLTGDQRQFLEIAKANPNVYRLTPGMVINIPDVFPETPNVYVAPGGELAGAGYATVGEIAAWYADPANVGRMPSLAFTTTAPVTTTAPITTPAAATTPVSAAFQFPQQLQIPSQLQPLLTVPEPTPTVQQTVQQTAEGRQREGLTAGQAWIQGEYGRLLAPGPARPRGGYSLTDILREKGYPFFATPAAQPAAAPPAAAPGAPRFPMEEGVRYPTTKVPGARPPTTPLSPDDFMRRIHGYSASIADFRAVAEDRATPEQAARVAGDLGYSPEQIASILSTTTAAAPAPTRPARRSQANPYYRGGPGPTIERNKTLWGNVIYDTNRGNVIYTNAVDYAEKLAETPLRDSGLLLGLFTWRAGW